VPAFARRRPPCSLDGGTHTRSAAVPLLVQWRAVLAGDGPRVRSTTAPALVQWRATRALHQWRAWRPRGHGPVTRQIWCRGRGAGGSGEEQRHRRRRAAARRPRRIRRVPPPRAPDPAGKWRIRRALPPRAPTVICTTCERRALSCGRSSGGRSRRAAARTSGCCSRGWARRAYPCVFSFLSLFLFY
jgi:hypothetical protein